MMDGMATSNGQRLYYQISGEGPPLVLIMGIGYDSSLWGLHQVPALSQHFRVIAFDNRDAGRSSRADTSYSLDDLADDVAGLLDALSIDRAHVLGLSMGAMIAQTFALRHPERLDRLVLTGTGAATARSAFDPISVWTWVKQHDDEGTTFAAQQFVWLFSSDFLRQPEAVDQTLTMLTSHPHPLSPEAYARQAEAYLAHDLLDRLPEIGAPTLVISGERDLLTPPWLAHEVAKAIPRARFELVTGPGASHLLPLERPGDFNQLVTAFLQVPRPQRRRPQPTASQEAPV